MIRAVVFDLGGVVFDSPLHVIAAYEVSNGVAPGTINRAVMEAGSDGAWARYERAEIGFAMFCVDFARDCEAAGGEVDAKELMRQINEATKPRPVMLDAIQEVRTEGRLVGALTNNWTPIADESFKARFDVVVESSVEGLRKPQVAMYEAILERLGVEASEALFLDDIGANLKPARAMGMQTIKVVTPEQALAEMWEFLSR